MNDLHSNSSTIRRLRAALVASLVFVGTSLAQEPPAAEKGTRRALIVCGLPGDDEHRTLYADAVEKIAKALVDRCGFAASDVWVRFGVEPKDGDGPALKGSRGLSNIEGLTADAEALRKASTPDDAAWVIVLGHGHYNGRRSHLNIPGPDLSDQAFGRLFEGLKAKEQVFMITTSASGFFLKPLAKAGRIAISATEADQEVNETLFPLALADMLAAPTPDADRDKDGALSVFELYLAIVADVTRRYIEDELIPSEHAQLDDNGDGRGSEVQRIFLPPESGGEAPSLSEKSKAKAKPKEKAEPKLGPKDDGFLASKVLADRPIGGQR
jgi:hypothetical protein